MKHTVSLASTVLASTVIAMGLTVVMATRSLAKPPHPLTLLAIVPNGVSGRQPIFNPQGSLAPILSPEHIISSSRVRSDCETDPRPMRLIAPEEELPRRSTPLTLESRPTVFAFIPQSLASYVEMVIFDEHHTMFYEATFNLPSQTGIVGFPWPEAAPDLEIGHSYFLFVALVCNSDERSSDIGAGGWIQRQSLSTELASTLDAMPLGDRPSFLTEQGFWYDAISSLIQLRLADPQNQRLQDDWNSLLTSVDLQSITQESISWFEYIPFDTTDRLYLIDP